MAIQVQFSGLAPVTRTVDIPEEDMAKVYDLVVNYFLALVPFMDLEKCAYIKEKEAIVEFLEKYDVPIDHPSTVASFFRSALGRSNG